MISSISSEAVQIIRIKIEKFQKKDKLMSLCNLMDKPKNKIFVE